MSSCVNGKWQAGQLGWTACLLAMLACGTARAQSDAGGQPFLSAAEGRLFTGTTPLRIWHSTRSYAQEASDTAFGGRWATDLDGAIGFVDGQFRLNNDSRGGGNLGGGFRWFEDSILTGETRILGVSGWYDGQETFLNKYFNQMGVSLESLGEYVDLRLNANIPLEGRKLGDTTTVTNDLNFTGNSLAQATFTPTDVSLRVVDFEVATRVFDLNVWAYGGGYEMDGDGVSEFGAKGGVRGYVTNDLVLGVTVTDDDVFGTNTSVQIIWTPGRTGAGPTWWVHSLADRMREQVYRNQYIATRQVQTEGSIVLTNPDGSALRIVHVDSTKPDGGDGTAERPLNTLTAIQGNSQQGDVILARAKSNFADQTATLKDEQRFLGEGNNITHTVATQQLGVVTLPESTPGALMMARPIIDNTGSGLDAVVLNATTVDQSTFTAMEVSNFTITDAARGIASGANGVGAVNVNNVSIADSSQQAIALAALTEDLATDRLRFQPTINTVAFTNNAGGDIRLDSNPGLAQPDTTTTNEAIAISNVTSTGTSGVSIDLQNTRRTATLSNITYDGGANGIGGLRVQNSLSAASVIMNGTNSFTGGTTTAPDTQGFAISLQNANSDQTFTGTTINNTGGDSFIVTGGSNTSATSFMGRINKLSGASPLGSAVFVSGGHAGTLVFNELTANAGVISQTVGDGLQFNNADGAYTFNDTVTLAGANAGIDVTNGSAGTFMFADGQITDPTGEAVNINGSSAVFTYSGAITANNAAATAAKAIAIENNTGGSVTFNSTVDTSRGIVINANTGGTNRFSQQVTITGSTETGVAITNNTAGSTQFDNIDITKTGTAAGFQATSAAPGYTVTVLAGNGNVISTATGVALTLNTIAAGASGINFQSVSSSGAVNGVTINNVTGGAVNIGSGQTTAGAGGSILNSTGNAVQITDSANVSINRMIIDGTAAGFDGIEVNHTNSVASTVAVTNSEIHDGLQGIDYNRSASGTSRITITGVTVDTTAAEGIAMDIGGSGTANITVNGSTQVTAGNDEALSINTSGGSAKTVNLLVDASTFNNNSTSATTSFLAGGAGTLNATVTNNVMNNADPASGRAFAMESASPATTVRLNLNANNATNAAATAEYLLTETSGDFNIQDKATVTTRNNGAFDFVPNFAAFDDDAGPIPTP